MENMKIQVNVGIKSSLMLKNMKIQVNIGIKFDVFSHSVDILYLL